MRQYFKDSQNPFHVYNRGVDKRITFTNDFERERFIALMYISNIGRPLYLSRQNISPAVQAILNGAKPDENLYHEEHEPLVAFISWALMPNHFHFLLVSLQEGGISKYMHKLNTASTKYFNKLHERSGSLFQGPYQSIEVMDPEYLYHLSRYIHLNPVELKEHNWKERGVQNWPAAKNFLEEWEWSSYPDFIGKRKSLLIARDLISGLFEEEFSIRKGVGLPGYKKFIEEWLSRDFGFIENYTLE